jgi:hypothetical protein
MVGKLDKSQLSKRISQCRSAPANAKGEYEVFKDGTKKTLITGESILERRRKTLKPATFKAPQSQGSRFHTIRRRPAEAA